jgi:DNA modification methylase
MSVRIMIGDVREQLQLLPADHVDCVVTSPPYWGLRDYGVAGQIGLEPTLGEHLAVMVDVFEEVKRVLKPTGTLWLNYGDCYATSPNGRSAADTKAAGNDDRTFRDKPFSTVGAIYAPDHEKGDRRGGDCKQRTHDTGDAPHKGRIMAGGTLKPKDLCLIPNRLAQALQAPRYLGNIKSEIDRVWLAAIIDGEGSIYIHRQPEGTPTGRNGTRTQDNFCVGIAIANCSEAIVSKAAAICGKDNIHMVEESGNRRNHYHWRVTGNVAKAILEEVYPYLVAKQREARVAIGCPSSGDIATACWIALKDLHKGRATDFDLMPPKRDLWGQGWWVRSEIIWHKPNPMPESIKDRPATSHEKVFLLSKRERYFYDADAIAEDLTTAPKENYPARAKITGRGQQASSAVRGNDRDKSGGFPPRLAPNEDEERFTRNCRNVWTIATQPFPEAHFATFPPELAERCIKAGCPAGGTVLDPFAGAGTTGLVADRLQRSAILIELNPEYAALARRRIDGDSPLFARAAE